MSQMSKKIVSSHSNPPVRGSETYTWPHRDLWGETKNESFDCVLIMVKMYSNEPKMNLYDI